MKEKFTLIGILMALSTSIPMFAETTHVTINKIDGTKISYLLSDSPKISYNKDCLLVSGPVRTSFSIDEVASYNFTDGSLSSVQNLDNNEVRIIYVDNSNVKAEGLTPNSSVVLYSAAGNAIKQINATDEGVAELVLPETKGIYILKTDSQSIKLVKE